MEEANQGSTAKLIQLDEYDRTLGTDELNLAEFPLAVLASRTEPGQSTLLFEDSIYDEGARAQVQRSLVIAGSDHFGLPTALDSDILLVLVHLSNVRNGFKSRRVEFSRYELINFLGWSQDGKSYKRLDESLRRWTSVTLHYKHAWWQRSKEKWRSRSFHVIETLELRAKDEIHDDGLSSFTWNEVIFDSFNAGNLRRINLDTYFALHHSASKQMFRFLGKRFYRSAKLQFDLRQFAVEHIGLSRHYDNYELKRKLIPAIKELVSVGFLTEMPLEEQFQKRSPGKWSVTFIRGKQSKANEEDANTGVVKDLMSRGVFAKVANDLGSRYPAEHIAEKIAIHDEFVTAKDRRVSKNPPGFLVSAIRGEFPTEASRKERRTRVFLKQRTFAAKSVEETSSESDSAFSAYWNSLAIEEQAKLERDALDAAPRFHKQIISRLESNQSALRAEMKQKLIREFAMSQGLWKPEA